MTNAILRGKPDAGNPHVRFDEGEVASAKPRRGSLLYKTRMMIIAALAAVGGFAATPAEILWTKPICVETNKYIGWPTVCRRANGELLAVFSGDREEHVCPYGKVQLVRSSDGGETWSAPETIRNTCLDDRDAGIIELKDGTLVVFTFSSVCYASRGNKRYNRICHELPKEKVREEIGNWSLRSTDGGKTWEKPVRMQGSAPHGGIQLKDGRLLMVGCSYNLYGTRWPEYLPILPRPELTVETSSDGARSWQVIARITPPERIWTSGLCEPHVVELDDGKLVAQIRYHDENDGILQTESTDGGKTWSELHETGIPGFPPHLLRLADGRILSSYGRRDEGHYGEYVAVSSDGGKSWAVDAFALDVNPPCYPWDLGYPSTVQFPDGTFLTTYYQSPDKETKPRLMATRWRIPRAEGLEAGFLVPPHAAKPHTWYHLMNGNVTKAGITRDFEALAEAGFGGVQMFDAGCNIPPGGLDFNSPAWFDMFRHAAAEARRLGLEICIPNCSGWSSSGGPWNPPSNGMKRVVWSEKRVKGPFRFHERLPRETDDHGFYADIAVLAFPTPPAELATFPGVKTTIGEGSFTLSSDAPFTARGCSYRLGFWWHWNGAATLKVEVSDDGMEFRPLETYRETLSHLAGIETSFRYHAFPRPVTARAIRVTVVESTVKVSVEEAHPENRRVLADLKAKTFGMRQEVPCETLAAQPDQVVGLASVRDLTANLAADGTLDWEVPEGEWTVLRLGFVCTGVKNHPASKYGVGLEIDKLSAAAMDYHFEQYVARLCRTLGPLAGKVESGFNNVLVDSYEVGSQNWTQGLEHEFRKRRGYDLTPYLPVFARHVVGGVEESERFLEDFRRVVADLFAENYAGKLAAKCREYGLMCSLEPYGNCPSDNLQYGQYVDIPMTEFWSAAANPYDPKDGNAQFASYIAHVWGKPICATESFTASPSATAGRWMTTPFSIKAQGDLAFADGINRLIYHRFTHQPWADDKYLPGMTMGRWGMHLDRTQTWWPYAKPFFRYQARCQYLLQRGTFVADALFFAGEDAPNEGGNVGHEGKGRIAYSLPEGYAWDVCPTDAMHALKVEDGEVVVPGGVRYRLLVMPEVVAMTPRMLKTVRRLQDAGATIVWTKKPVRAPGLQFGAAGDSEVRRLADEVFAKGVCSVSPAEALRRLGIPPQAEALALPKDVKRLNWIHRREADADWFFVAMPNRDESEVEVAFRVRGREPEIWDAETGEMKSAAVWRTEGERTVVRVPFNICGSKFVVFRKPTERMRSDAASARQPEPTVTEVVGSWEVSFPNGFLPNALAKGVDKTVVFEKLGSWSERPEEGVRYFSGTAVYRKQVQVPAGLPKGTRLVLDLGEVREVAEVTVNGRTFDALWRPPFRVDITDAVTNGTADLSIRVANLWANRLIGDDRLYAPDCEWDLDTSRGLQEHPIKEIPQWVKDGKPSPTGRHTFTTFRHWCKDDELRTSGLLGPVTLRMP